MKDIRCNFGSRCSGHVIYDTFDSWITKRVSSQPVIHASVSYAAHHHTRTCGFKAFTQGKCFPRVQMEMFQYDVITNRTVSVAMVATAALFCTRCTCNFTYLLWHLYHEKTCADSTYRVQQEGHILMFIDTKQSLEGLVLI